MTTGEQHAVENPLHYSPVPAGDGQAVYRLAPHPRYNAQTLENLLQPLVDHLNRAVARFRWPHRTNIGDKVLALGSLENRMLILVDIEKLMTGAEMGLVMETTH